MLAMASKATAVPKPAPPPGPKSSKRNNHTVTAKTTPQNEDNIIFIDMDAKKASSSAQEPDAENYGRIDPKRVIEQNNVSGPEGVYEIILRGEKIKNIEKLDSFKKCRSLDLSSNCIEILQNFHFLKDLRELKIYDNRISEIKNLEGLTELNNLQLQHNCIRTIGSGLSKLRKLKVLRLDNNCITEFSVKELTSCCMITSLDLSYNQIQDITPLNCLPNLEELRVNNNRLKQVQDLKRCRKLEDIDLSGNKLVDVSGLKGLPNLSVIDLSNNLMSSLASTGSLRKLRELNLSNNKFRQLQRLVGLFPELEILKLSNNRLDDWSEFSYLSKLENLVELYVDGNPCYDSRENHVTANQELTNIVTQLDILNGAQVQRKARASAPLMRPMSANSIISVKHVEHQIRSMESEMSAFEADLAKKFESMSSTLTSLPAASPKSADDVSESPRPQTASRQSRCGSRSKLRDAMMYASQNFDQV